MSAKEISQARHDPAGQDKLDDALKDSFPASDPVALKPPDRSGNPQQPAPRKEDKTKKPAIKLPQPTLDEDAIPPERPA